MAALVPFVPPPPLQIGCSLQPDLQRYSGNALQNGMPSNEVMKTSLQTDEIEVEIEDETEVEIEDGIEVEIEEEVEAGPHIEDKDIKF
ncbi:hypothetical protein RhiirC2_795002 [Rhizophagus irregularis]|uniref:Uncharacterized protein n=1 Tax=Rhizophagus irregularis TaxID=588596 RepID=A0A2N1MCE6_9GLOM|nr:hypothetical protein RhiirC2_795002 [Rhizophagus irregularis]